MSGETTMYALKPIVSLPHELYHSKTMYKMKNIHEEERSDDHTGGEEIKIVTDVTEQSPLPEFTALEARQEKILAQLADLLKQVSTLCDFLKQTNDIELSKDYINKEPVIVNLVVNANPKRPPYSLLALQRTWNDTDIKLQTYTHSSIKGQDPIIFISNESQNKNNVVNLSLIWKEVENLEVISGLQGYRLMGETNLLRYISRSIKTHNYESTSYSIQTSTIDTILDLCHCLHYQESPKKIQEVLSLIGTKLEKSQWFGKKVPNIADIAVWSAIKQVSPKKYPSNLNKWFETCEKVFT